MFSEILLLLRTIAETVKEARPLSNILLNPLWNKVRTKWKGKWGVTISECSFIFWALWWFVKFWNNSLIRNGPLNLFFVLVTWQILSPPLLCVLISSNVLFQFTFRISFYNSVFAAVFGLLESHLIQINMEPNLR